MISTKESYLTDNDSGQLEKENSIKSSQDNAGGLEKQLENDNILEGKLNNTEAEVVLTKREREILDFVLAGNTNKEIAQKLYRTERTIEYHRNRMMRKLGTHNPIELVKRAIAMGIA